MSYETVFCLIIKPPLKQLEKVDNEELSYWNFKEEKLFIFRHKIVIISD